MAQVGHESRPLMSYHSAGRSSVVRQERSDMSVNSRPSAVRAVTFMSTPGTSCPIGSARMMK